MYIKLKNFELIPAFNFLTEMKLKASDSRHRSKLTNILADAVQSLNEAEIDLAKQYCELDDLGEPIVDDESNLTFKSERDKAEFIVEKQQLLQEEVVLDFGMHEQNIQKVLGILQSYDGVISGDDAIIYDRLLDEFEALEGEK